jgi:hypothetical protein
MRKGSKPCSRRHEAAVERMDERAQLVVGGEQPVHLLPLGLGEGVEETLTRLALGRRAEHVQAFGNQRLFYLVDLGRELFDVGRVEVHHVRLVADHLFQIGALLRAQLAGAPAIDQFLQLGQALVEPGLAERRGEVGNQRRRRAPLGDQALGRVVGGIEVEIGQVAD